jgi:HAD superfamily hydrolase (TIGR01450 family)
MDNTAERLRAVRGFVLDLDGTLVLGDSSNKGLRPLPGAIAFTHHLDSSDIPFAILTNGTTRVPRDYAATLRDIGLPVRDEMMLTPAAVAGDYFKRYGFQRVMALGTEGVWRTLEDAGLEVVRPSEGASARGKCDAVFVGWFREFTFDDLETACHAVSGGAKLFTASMSPFFASAHGKTLGTARAICAMITSITAASATVLGKPSIEALQCASQRLGVACADLAVVGDDPALEIRMAQSGDSLAIAVHTGIGDDDAFSALPAAERPHIIVRDVEELLQLYVAPASR